MRAILLAVMMVFAAEGMAFGGGMHYLVRWTQDIGGGVYKQKSMKSSNVRGTWNGFRKQVRLLRDRPSVSNLKIYCVDSSGPLEVTHISTSVQTCSMFGLIGGIVSG